MGNAMIEDAEMQQLFKIESEEHLQLLDEGLLQLEKDPKNQKVLEDVFREAHSLKGAARMLGLMEIEAVSHRFEDILGLAHKGDILLSSRIVDVMYGCLDIIRKLVADALAGVPSKVDIRTVLTRLDLSIPDASANMERKPVLAMPDLAETATETLVFATEGLDSSHLLIHEPESFSSNQPLLEQFRIDTIRVETRKLDMLMRLAGELTVANLRIVRRHDFIEAFSEIWEQFSSGIRETGCLDAIRIADADRLSAMMEELRVSSLDDKSRLELVSGEINEEIRAIRLMPLATLFNLFPRMVRDISRNQTKDVQLIIEGGENLADKRIIEEMKDPLMHIIRNSVDHGIELPEERIRSGKPRTGTIRLGAYQTPSGIVMEIKDDGRGLDTEMIKKSAKKLGIYREDELAAMTDDQVRSLVFTHGLSTSSFVSDVSGRGVGMDAVRAGIERLKGKISIKSDFGTGCDVVIDLPLTLATARVLLVLADGLKYAVPVENVLKSCLIRKNGLFRLDGKDVALFEDKALSVASLSRLLHYRRTDFIKKRASVESPEPRIESDSIPCIVVFSGEERMGLFVDELIDEQEIVIKPQSILLSQIPNISGGAIIGTGEVCMVLNPHDLIRSLNHQNAGIASTIQNEKLDKKKLILLAEDSLTTRTQMKRILEGAGYEVVPAVDGMDAFSRLSLQSFDALVTDITMPNMDGLTLTAKVRQDKQYKDLPVILVTMLTSDEDKRKGLEAGASAYILKPSFDQKTLLDTLRRLI